MDPTLALVLGGGLAYYFLTRNPAATVATSVGVTATPPSNTPSDPNQSTVPNTNSTDPIPVNGGNTGILPPTVTIPISDGLGLINKIGSGLMGLGNGTPVYQQQPPSNTLDTAGSGVNLYGVGFGNQPATFTYGSGNKLATRYAPLDNDMANSSLNSNGGYVIGSGYR